MDGALAALGQARQATDQGASALASSRAEQAAQEQAARRAVAETPSQMPSAFDVRVALVWEARVAGGGARLWSRQTIEIHL